MKVVISGAFGAIGSEIARTFATRGDSLILLDQQTPDDDLAKVAIRDLQSLGSAAVEVLSLDFRRPQEVDALLVQKARTGVVDVLVNCAGMQHVDQLPRQSLENWLDVMNVNLTACFLTTKHFLPGMCGQGFGRIVNIASVHGVVASKEKAPYVSSKHGLVGLTKVTALEGALYGDANSGGVTANAICPGWVDTPLLDAQLDAVSHGNGFSREARLMNLLESKQPTQRLTQAAEIAFLTEFLCDRRSHNITGTAIPVDGGWTCH